MFPALKLPDLDALGPAALKAMILAQQDHFKAQHERYTATLTSRASEIERLALPVEKLQRMLFGAKSEKVLRQIEQLEFQLEDLQAASAIEEAHAVPPAERPAAAKPFRRPLPEHLPREVHTHLPGHEACPDCGGRLRELGEDVAEMLEYVRACFKVIRHVRPKLSCDACDRIVQAPAPSRPIDRGLAGPGLLAHVLVSKYADHQPLYRQSEIYAREGVDLDRSTLAGWVGATSELLAPLVEALRGHVMSASKLHADDTPVPVLATAQTTRLLSVTQDGKTYSGVWDTNKGENGGVTVAGSGALKGYNADITGNCGGTCVASGDIRSTAANAGNITQALFRVLDTTSSGYVKNAGTDAWNFFHPGATNFRGHADNDPQGIPSTHIPIDPKASLPNNEWHVDRTYPYDGAGDWLEHAGCASHTICNPQK